MDLKTLLFLGLLFFTSLLAIFVFYASRKKQIEIQRRFIRERDLVLEALMEGVLLIDQKGVVQYVNFAAGRILGSSKKLLEGKMLPEKNESYLLEKTKEILESCRRLRTPVTDSIVMENDKKLHLDVIVMPQVDLLGFIVIFQDKSSDHKVLEVGKDFVSSASHELKTPLTIIKGFAETLQDMKDLPKEIVEDILEKIVRNCHRMDTLVKNLLTLADIESLPLTNPQYCDLESLIEESRRVVLSVYPEARIEIVKNSESITAEVEPSLLELALLNLIGNAVKYSSSPAKVVICLRQNPDEVQIEVKDEGMGIPEDDLEHIFERFYTVNKAHSRKLGGAGLGLSLVQTIVEKHGGTIEAASTLGKGSTFTVLLPCHQH
jgi:two-component system phosphate regulon sensor histidine kinase PhoR